MAGDDFGPGNTYEAILTRNAFGLVPRPLPPEVTPPPPVLPDIKICGFVVTSNRVNALFAAVPKTPKERETYFDLTEGQTDGPLQLLKIHLDQQEADVVNSGVPMRLSMSENGFKVLPVIPSPPPAPTKPGLVPSVPLPPGFAATSLPVPK